MLLGSMGEGSRLFKLPLHQGNDTRLLSEEYYLASWRLGR